MASRWPEIEFEKKERNIEKKGYEIRVRGIVPSSQMWDGKLNADKKRKKKKKKEVWFYCLPDGSELETKTEPFPPKTHCP